MKKTRNGNKWVLSKIDRDILYQKYITENKSMKVISQELKRSVQSIHKYLHLYNIKVKKAQPYIHWTQVPKNKDKVKKRNINVKKAWKEIKKDTNRFEKFKITCLNNLKKANKALCKTTRKYPNKKEKKLNRLLQCLFPKEYKFVGNGKFFIEQFNPDFINVNGQKKLIEFYGDYWHNIPKALKRDERRLKTYSKYGYKTLVIWENELKNTDLLTDKIKVFN